MRYSQSEKMEIIRLVEDSKLSVRRTLEELEINRSSFYKWYRSYLKNGYEGLAVRLQNLIDRIDKKHLDTFINVQTI